MRVEREGELLSQNFAQIQAVAGQRFGCVVFLQRDEDLALLRFRGGRVQRVELDEAFPTVASNGSSLTTQVCRTCA